MGGRDRTYWLSATAVCRILVDKFALDRFGRYVQRLERLFAINEVLRREAPRRVSAARLAEDFGVTRRTIERDIATLLGAGVPLYAERGRHGGHISLDQVGNVVVTLSPSEVTALLVALASAGPDMPYADAGFTAAARLLDGLPPTTRLAVDALRNRVRYSPIAASRSARRVRRTIDSAVQRGVVVKLDYLDADGAVTSRRVDALGYYQGTSGHSSQGTRWYLIGWCHLRAAGRIFRLDRIQRANLTKTAVQPRDLDETLGWVPADVEAP